MFTLPTSYLEKNLDLFQLHLHCPMDTLILPHLKKCQQYFKSPCFVAHASNSQFLTVTSQAGFPYFVAQASEAQLLDCYIACLFYPVLTSCHLFLVFYHYNTS